MTLRRFLPNRTTSPRGRRPSAPWAVLVLTALAGQGCDDPTPAEGPLPPRAAATKPLAPGPRFVDRAREFGLDVVTKCGSPEKGSILDSLGTGVALFDADGDGDLDIFVAAGSEVRDGKVACAGGPWLFRNEGPGHWTDVSSRSGLTYTGWAQGVAVCDYDGDGDVDLFVAQHGPDTLWQNQGDGTFRDVTRAAGITENAWGVSATWGDYDGDGWPDLFVANYVTVDALRPPEPIHYYGGETLVFRGPDLLEGQPDALWRNRGDGTFENVTEAAGVLDRDGKGMSALFADLDGDGILDVYVTNDGQANFLYRGLGRGRFREEAIVAGVAFGDRGQNEAGMAIALADLDGDGRLDLARTNFHHEGTRLNRNLNGVAYTDVSGCSGVTAMTVKHVGWGLIVADFDDDGRPDLFQANGHVFPKGPKDPYHQPPLLLRNEGGERFEDVTQAWGDDLASLKSGRAVASGDLDGDGDLDLVMTTIDGPLRVLINEGTWPAHKVTVRLVGQPPNRDAVGARVELVAGGQRQVGTVCRGGSILAASDSAPHFGLGTATSVEKLRVTWPDGTASLFTADDLKVDSLITVRQGAASATVEPFVPRAGAAR